MTIVPKSDNKHRETDCLSRDPRHCEIPSTNCVPLALSGKIFVLDQVDFVTEQRKDDALVPIMDYLLEHTNQPTPRVVQAARLQNREWSPVPSKL